MPLGCPMLIGAVFLNLSQRFESSISMSESDPAHAHNQQLSM